MDPSANLYAAWLANLSSFSLWRASERLEGLYLTEGWGGWRRCSRGHFARVISSPPYVSKPAWRLREVAFRLQSRCDAHACTRESCAAGMVAVYIYLWDAATLNVTIDFNFFFFLMSFLVQENTGRRELIDRELREREIKFYWLFTKYFVPLEFSMLWG